MDNIFDFNLSDNQFNISWQDLKEIKQLLLKDNFQKSDLEKIKSLISITDKKKTKSKKKIFSRIVMLDYLLNADQDI